MNIVIAAPGAKRVINGEFALCASRADFEYLVGVLRDKLHDESWTYGWIRVPLPAPLMTILEGPAQQWVDA